MTTVLRTFLFAWQFLTAIPLSRSTHDAKPEELAASLEHCWSQQICSWRRSSLPRSRMCY